MKLTSKIIQLSLILIGIYACQNNSPIKISEIDGKEFVSCNIDKIRNTFDLKLSEIAEYSEIVVLQNDSNLVTEDYNIDQITVSDSFIVVMPEQKPALLFSRTGKFIKRLGGHGKQKYLWAIRSQINEQENKVYIQIPGFEQLYVFGLRDNSFERIDWAIKHTYDFVLIDSKTLYGVIHEKEHWGYFQDINAPVASLISARYSNVLHPYFSSAYQLLYDGDKVVLDFYRDTTYYFNAVKKTFIPFLRCHSEEYAINPYRVLEKISQHGVDYEKITDGKPFHYKHLIYAANGYYIFSIRKEDQDKRHLFAINKHDDTAFYIDSLINDFFGNIKVEVTKAVAPNHRLNNKDGYLTFHYNISQFKKIVNKIDSNAIDESTRNKVIQLRHKLENDKGYCNVLFINKLKK